MTFEDRMDSLADRVESIATVAEATTRAVEKLLQVVASHEERLVGVEDRQAEMQAAMKALFETIDRFIRGLGSDGHKQGNAGAVMKPSQGTTP